jgi:hypothetical protein
LQSCRSTFVKHRTLTLPCIYLFKILFYMHRYNNKYLTRNNIHNYDTRRKSLMSLDRRNYALFKKSPLYAGCSLYNKLLNRIRNITLTIIANFITWMLLFCKWIYHFLRLPPNHYLLFSLFCVICRRARCTYNFIFFILVNTGCFWNRCIGFDWWWSSSGWATFLSAILPENDV